MSRPRCSRACSDPTAFSSARCAVLASGRLVSCADNLGPPPSQTTVLVTHAIHRLPSAHRIIVLESGSISHFCSFAELQGHDLALIKSVREEAKQAEADPAGKVAKDAFEAQEGEADEEEDEEMSWSESSKLGAYRFFVRSAGPRNVLLSAVLLLSYPAVNMGLQGYLKALSTSGSISGAWFGGYAGFCAASALTLTAAFWHFTCVRLFSASDFAPDHGPLYLRPPPQRRHLHRQLPRHPPGRARGPLFHRPFVHPAASRRQAPQPVRPSSPPLRPPLVLADPSTAHLTTASRLVGPRPTSPEVRETVLTRRLSLHFSLLHRHPAVRLVSLGPPSLSLPCITRT